MAHEVESAVFAGNRLAWHGLGTVFPSEALDTGETLTHSGLAGWGLTKRPIYHRKERIREQRRRSKITRDPGGGSPSPGQGDSLGARVRNEVRDRVAAHDGPGGRRAHIGAVTVLQRGGDCDGGN